MERVTGRAADAGVVSRNLNFRLGITATLALTVLVFSVRFLFPYSDPKFLCIALASGLLPWAVAAAFRRRVGGEELTLLVVPGLITVWSAVSGAWASNGFEFVKGLAFNGGCLGVFYAAAALARTDFIRRLVTLVSLLLLIVSIYGLLQKGGFEPLTLTVDGQKVTAVADRFPTSTFGNVNFAAHFVTPALCLCAAGLWEAARTRRISFAVVWRACALLAGVGFLLVGQSRGGFLAACIGLTAFAILLLRQRPLWVRAAVGGGVLLVVVLAGLTAGGLERFRSRSETASKTSAMYRAYLWRDSLELIAARPVLGTGLWNYDTELAGSLSKELLAQQSNAFGDERITRAHNDYLNVATELGVPAGLLFAFFVLLVLRRAWKVADSAAGSGAAAALIALASYALIDFPLYNPPSAAMFWIIAGLTVRGASHIEFKQVTLIETAGAVAVAIAVGLPWIAYLYGSAALRVAGLEKNRGAAAAARDRLLRTQQKTPFNRDLYPALTAALRNSGENDKAEEFSRRWIALEPHFSAAHNALGSALAAQNRNEEALSAFLTAHKLATNNAAAAANAATLYYLAGNHKQAYQLYKVVFEQAATRFQPLLRNYADAAFESGEFAEAARLLSQYVQTHADDPEMTAKLQKARAWLR